MSQLTQEQIFFGKLEDIASKSLTYGTQVAKRNEPKVFKLMDAFIGWLDKKSKAA